MNIKFRLLDRDRDEWEYVSILDLINGDTSNLTDVDLDTIGQFIGLKDKNGKDIYNGDIINAHRNDANFPLNYVVVFNEKELCFRMRWVGRFKAGDGFYDESLLFNAYKVFEVIGNIHQNPELLK